jgi:hypothetical protein
MLDRYGRAATYSDRGTSMRVMKHGDGRENRSRIDFETAFERTSRAFFFDYRHTHEQFFPERRAVIWRAADGPARIWWTLRPATEEVPIEMALAAQTGVSGGIAWNVPSLLLHLGNRWSSRNFRLDGEENIDVVRCNRLVERERDRESIVWIEADGHALRRMFTRTHFPAETRSEAEVEAEMPPGLPEEQRPALIEALRHRPAFDAEDMISYAPVFDQPIAASRFAFTPPESAGPAPARP